MASKGGKDPKKGSPADEDGPSVKSVSQQAYDPIVKDDTQFPVPELYFKVFDSEVDEPDAKIRRDVAKLYERWQKKYGRRWPENGMNTEDLVWLQEEAYKPSIPVDERGNQFVEIDSTPASARQGLVPLEKERYPGEFLPEPWEGDAAGAATGRGGAAVSTAAGGAAAGGSKPRTISNYEATAAGGNWVTDEFESVDYEAGNLETLYNMNLWDYEGKPLLMPDGPPDEAQGEESEEWDDFYGSYRPRFVDTDEARQAVWATDEFESDEDNTESEWEPEYVGAGVGLVAEDPVNPQYSLRHSNHPLAPFPGEPLKWSSFAYDDGTTYEGLTRDAVPHGMGVMIFGNGTGGGFHFRDVRRGDKYEGEFQAGYAHGLGQMTSETRGEVYVGEFFAGQRHGCGIRINMQPYYYLLARGENPVAAYQQTHDTIMRNIEFRTWYRNKALGSDHEDEVVLHAVRDDMDNPYQVVMRNARHEQKLRDWATMDSTEKALLKAVEIIEQVGDERRKRRGGKPPRQNIFIGENAVHDVLDTEGNDTDWDSVELMVGVESDGGPGLGWVGDTQDSAEFPPDSRLQEQINADVIEDKFEESEDKEMVLGEDLVNPFTGLTLRDYLDGREGQYKQLLRVTGAIDALAGRSSPASLRGGRNARGRMLALADGDESSYVAGDEAAAMQRIVDQQLSRPQQLMFAEHMARTAALYGGDDDVRPQVTRDRNPWSEDTDTRFETESEVMELCDLAEILGTVDEAREVVAKARMWRWKPDGEVTLRYAQDAHGTPVALMQDPLHYPHGTKFMAPGPLGQCHPVPDDQAIRAEMVRAAKNYMRTYNMYNFDYDPEPGTVQYKIDARIKRAQELRMQSLARMAEAAEEELAAEQAAAAGTAAVNPQLQLAELPEEAVEQPTSSSGSSSSSMPQSRVQSSHRGMPPPPAAFASMSMAGMGLSVGLSRASRVVLDVFSNAAKAVPSRRRQLTRPSHMRRSKQQ